MIPKKYADEWLGVLGKIIESLGPKKVVEIPRYDVNISFIRQSIAFFRCDNTTFFVERVVLQKMVKEINLGWHAVSDLGEFRAHLEGMIPRPTCKEIKAYVELKSADGMKVIELNWRDDESKC